MRINIRWVLTSTLMLTACGGSGGGGGMGQANGFCYAISQIGGGATCTGCSMVTDQGNAFDGSLTTYASMGSGGQGTFSGTAAAQPAGRVAGVYFVLPGNTGNSITVSITTLLNGTVQETGGPSTEGPNRTCASSMDCLGNGTEGYIGLHTTKSYDTIQATISNGSVGTAHINELCVR